jgi:hypothetical protein
MSKLENRLISQEQTVPKSEKLVSGMGSGIISEERPISPLYFQRHASATANSVVTQLKDTDAAPFNKTVDMTVMEPQTVGPIHPVALRQQSTKTLSKSFKIGMGISFLLLGAVCFFITNQVIHLAHIGIPTTETRRAPLPVQKHVSTITDEENDPFTLLGVSAGQQPGSELSEKRAYASGRTDPFLPLAQTEAPVVVDPEKERDVLESVHFTGFIDDPNPKYRVALLKVADLGGTEKTHVKKVSETVFVDGHSVKVRQVNKDVVTLSVDGVTRTLPMDAFVDSPLVASSGSGSKVPGSAASGNSPSTASAGTPRKNEISESSGSGSAAAKQAKSERILDGLVE